MNPSVVIAKSFALLYGATPGKPIMSISENMGSFFGLVATVASLVGLGPVAFGSRGGSGGATVFSEP